MFGLGYSETLALLVLGVLLFGKRLPEVGRSLGRTVMEFRNSLRGVEDEFRTSFREPPPRPPQRLAPTAPKFTEPPAAAD